MYIQNICILYGKCCLHFKIGSIYKNDRNIYSKKMGLINLFNIENLTCI